jgi:hypothetical protein
LITTADGEVEAKRLVDTTFYEIKDAIAIMTWMELIELYESTKKYIEP